MVERNLLPTYFIIITLLGFVLCFNYTTKKDSDEVEDDLAVGSGNAEAGLDLIEQNMKLSCIFCDNVKLDDCNDPKNKLIPLIACEHYDDVCYSMHTPFGVIDRGCYNPNRNLTTYVCSCNLCNNMPIELLPVKFTNLSDWLENVIDLSRTRGLRKSILKKISCVRCEANTTYESEYLRGSTLCFDGNVTALPIQNCIDGEICGIKYLKNQGYIWRGCIERPLYNYWWSFCREDLCNYDVIGSLYNHF